MPSEPYKGISRNVQPILISILSYLSLISKKSRKYLDACWFAFFRTEGGVALVTLERRLVAWYVLSLLAQMY